jgi:hypothetical protein
MASDLKHPESSQETDSLVKRLAGPSTGKAGFVNLLYFRSLCFTEPTCRLAKDQTEINRIIAEASKGSKFYEVCASQLQVSMARTDWGIAEREEEGQRINREDQ